MASGLDNPSLMEGQRTEGAGAKAASVGHKAELTSADLAYDSEYNTYLYKGLPPGPICCPGYSALYAATHPEQHNYFYYVAQADGTHLFANSYRQHEANIAAVSAAE